MSGLANKTPKETFKDLIVIGENYIGLTDKMSQFTDGVGNPLLLSSSVNSIDINFNGGNLGSHLSNNICNKFQIERLEYNGTYELTLGNPGVQFWMPMFFSEPDPGPTSICFGPSGFDLCRAVTVFIKKPQSLESLSSFSSYAKTDLYLSSDDNSIVVEFYSYDGYFIDGITSFRPTSKGFDLLRIEFINNSITSNKEIKISLIAEDIFDLTLSDLDGSLKSLCEDTWSIYGEYTRKGKSSKPGVPLSEATPGGSYKDILFLNNNNNGITSETVDICDGLGNNFGLSISENSFSINSDKINIQDPIFGSTHESVYELNIVDTQSEYYVDNLNSNHILINRESLSPISLNAKITIDLDNLPIYNSDFVNEMFVTEINISYAVFVPGYLPTNVEIRFFKNEYLSEYFSFVIPSGYSTSTFVKKFIILHKEDIIEIINL